MLAAYYLQKCVILLTMYRYEKVIIQSTTHIFATLYRIICKYFFHV